MIGHTANIYIIALNIFEGSSFLRRNLEICTNTDNIIYNNSLKWKTTFGFDSRRNSLNSPLHSRHRVRSIYFGRRVLFL
jgi:hypothetical protein